MTMGQVLAELSVQSPGIGWLESLALVAGIVAVVFAYTAGLFRPQNAPPARVGLLSLRLGAIICAFAALWHPAWVRTTQLEQRPQLAVVLDDSASMQQPAGGDEVTTRYARAVEILNKHLGPAVRETHELRVFDAQARAVDLDSLPRGAQSAQSPLTDTLLRVQQDLRDRSLTGIVLLSDGREVSARPAAGGLERLRVPIYAVPCAEATPVGGAIDVAINAVATNRHALLGSLVLVEVDLGATGLPADQALTLSVLTADQTVATRTVKWPAGESALRSTLEFAPRQAGELTYAVQVGAGPQERDFANNRQTFSLCVRARPLTVLYIDGVLRWEAKFLREALAADPDLNVVSTIRTAPPGTDRGSQGLLRSEQLANVDVVILGDVEAAFFSTSEMAALRTWIVDAGGALLLTGGYGSFGPEGFGRTVLRDVLPVEFSADPNPQNDQPFNLKLTDAGREHPIFHLSGDRVRDAAFFQALPPLAGCSRIAGVKPGAEVLAVNPQIGADGAAGLPVLVAQDVGAGRTLVFAVDTTWKWRTIVGGFTGDSEFYPRFWGQLVRWLAADEEEHGPRLIVATDRTRYPTGQPVEVNIELTPGAGEAGTSESVRGARDVAATALTETGDRFDVPLTELDSTHWRGTLTARTPGRLDVFVYVTAATDDEAARGLSAVATVAIEHPDLELRDPRPDPQWLAQVTQLTGGRTLQPAQIAAWAATLPAETVTHVQTASSGLIGDRVLGAVFLGLLCTEWVLRRRSRLA